MIGRRASLEEQPDAVEVDPLAREDERGSPVTIRRPDARAALEQQPHRLGLPVTSGPGEQRVLQLGVDTQRLVSLACSVTS